MKKDMSARVSKEFKVIWLYELRPDIIILSIVNCNVLGYISVAQLFRRNDFES